MSTSITESSAKRKKMAIAAGTLAGAVAIGGTFAFFTDRHQANATATAGTVDLALDANWQDNENFNPGDKADLNYEISNEGNKSVDVRERIVVKSDVAMDPSQQAEFEVYRLADVELDASGSYVPKQGAVPVTEGADRVVSADNMSITYNIAEYTLDGTGTAAETEPEASGATSKASEYVLVFKRTASNAFQGANVTVDLVAEAKQHRNTDGNTWAEISTESITAGGSSINVVPQK